jgi:hypothetical protein
MNYQTTKCEFLGSVKIKPCLHVESQNEKDRILEIKGRQALFSCKQQQQTNLISLI